MLTVAAANRMSSLPNGGLMVFLMKALIPPKTKAQVIPSDVAISIHTSWSLSLKTANGGYWPAGTGNALFDIDS